MAEAQGRVTKGRPPTSWSAPSSPRTPPHRMALGPTGCLCGGPRRSTHARWKRASRRIAPRGDGETSRQPAKARHGRGEEQQPRDETPPDNRGAEHDPKGVHEGEKLARSRLRTIGRKYEPSSHQY